ncbi:sigma-54-dependent Fis family transcriptional regulator [Clostridium botulinum]|uniref:sigma-54-dependent Fis family transcriptional regulator n=1 Tax=Clostridium botulinum TaxID=1491 RepID=UPI00100E6F96|nr:sigma 54-interacting transcriptional regulator [Clostridium botulinum]MBD5562411.1 sigma 54-interacting transcriptional regulator [Clostridium botulinum]MBD5566146.1 sigma 54-interacting transcriptional regulator [Clostridium botulinum]MBD5569338.1 sigma 54-interacting transcriptional regulator [Clostridium botulinum]MBD5572324.1 sigma 54-interacting transcriptional regulator [Clostridium botulinum]MBD5576045.1 sigma 54-interacting transcriptional regulator [Clostridium botulinum]
MKDYLKFIHKAWEKFIETDYIDNKVRIEIAESWRRCKDYSVDYMNGRGSSRNKISVEFKGQENAQLISVAKPIMRGIYNIVEGSDFAIILSDKDGYIIEVIGDKDIMKRVEELNFVKGALWTEKAVGTNAIGTALCLDKPIQTIGAEHFCISQHSWTCSACPIHDEYGNIIGCLNMSGNSYNAHSHTLGIVTASAQAIEKQLALTISYNLINITFDSISEGMIILDKNFNIKRLNHRAEEILFISSEYALGINIHSILKNISFKEILKESHKSYSNIEGDFHINDNRVKCIVNAVPIKSNRKITGIVITFREATLVHKLVNKVIGYKASYNFDNIITVNEKMIEIIELAKKASKSNCNILIEGESGTGKELIAQSIHNYSMRAAGPFLAVNCASIPRELVESELFGYERGAFTGASKEGHPGKFELADEGTIFLDELGELPLDMQSKLLRVLDNNKIIRVGGTYEKQLNVRVIGATNRNLKEEMKKKNFREDLYYRLGVINIKILPLRYRKEDIEVLVNSFVMNLNQRNLQQNKRVKKAYIDKLKEYDWPGNVRELRNVVERDYYLSDTGTVSPYYIEKNIFLETNNENYENKDINIIPMEKLEKENIENAIEKCDGNLAKAARLLDIGRSTLYRKIKKYNIKERYRITYTEKE